MKIIRLSLNNLASLAGEQHIHFEQAPLAQAGLIAITGKTGAGKSTLLDAMCLALYDEIPRLRGAAGSMKDVGGKDISIKDSKNILRRGTTAGFAELEFLALDGKRYLARWDISRARKKVDGNLKVERFVQCLDDGATLTQKISEVTPLIEKLIGLSFEQFTRAVLLAQSEVGAFLKAKDHERADLLEYLTNSQIFSEVSKKAADKFSEIKQQRTDLEKQLGHIDILSEEQLAALNQQHQQLKQQLVHLAQSEKLLENERKWYLERDQLYAEVHGKKEIYEVQLDAINKSAAQQQLLQQLDAFQAIREQYVQRARLEPQKLEVQQKQLAFQAEFVSLQQQATTEQQRLKAYEHAQAQFEQQRLDVKPHLEQGLKLDHDIHSISEQYKKLSADKDQLVLNELEPSKHAVEQQKTSVLAWQNKQQQINFELTQSQFLQCFDQEPQSTLQALQHYVEQYQLLHQQEPELLQQSFATLEQQQQTVVQRLQSYVAQHESLDALTQSLKNIQQQREQHQSTVLRLQHQQQQLEQVINHVSEIQTLTGSIAEQQKQLQIIQQTLEKRLSEKATQEAAYTQLQSILEAQRLLHSENVQHLREQLKANQPCMVCGSHEHPFLQSQQRLEQGLLQLHEQQLQEARQQLEQFNREVQQAQIEQSKVQTLLEQQQQRVQQLTQSTQQQIVHIQAALQQLGLDLDTADPIQLQQRIMQQIETLQSHIEQQQAQEQQLGQLLEQWRKEQQQQQQLQLNIQRRVQLDQGIQPIVQLLPARYQQDMPIHWVAELQQQLQQRVALLTMQKQVETSLLQAQQELEKMTLRFEAAQKHEQHLTHQIEQLIEQGKMLRSKLAELTQDYAGQSYRYAADWQKHLEETAVAHANEVHAQRSKTAHAEQQLNAANLQQQQLLSDLHHIEQALQQVQQAIQQWQLSHPTVTTDQITTWLSIDLAQHQQIRHELNTQRQLLENAKTAWQVLEERYQAHLKHQPEHDLSMLEQRLANLQTEKLAQQEALTDTETQLRMNAANQANYAKYQSQIEQIKAEEYRWGRIYDLIGHKEGTKFKKIAQEHHLDILVEYANQQLQPLAPRYQLHRIPDSLSLAIIDLDMNSEVRPVLSLSGGETFLVSLALALAIANMASGSMKLESLFIDEGFGTLDPASLHMVMNALDHLQSQGRKVVLISHVQEMHERIPVQIQVKPVGAGASTINIVG